MEWSTILFQIILFLIVLFLYANKRNSYWSDRGIHGPLGLPFLGNLWEQLWKGQLVCEIEWMKKFGKCYGTYNFMKPSLTILDNELIKQVMVKDFHLFVNRRKNRSDHEIWSRNLFGVENEDWKRIRSITSPTFTSGKLKTMVPLMNICVNRLLEYLNKLCLNGDAVIDCKKVISGFSIEVIASTAFATEVKAIDQSSAFVENGMKAFLFHPLRTIGLTFIPARIRKIFGFTLNLDPTSFNFFVELSQAIIDARRRNPDSKGNDLVQLLMDSRVSEKDLQNNSNYDKLAADMDNDGTHQADASALKSDKSLTDNEIIAQMILFYVAGFETTASTISHCLFELARNPETQERLLKELQVLEGVEPDSDKFVDIAMNQIPYLDALIKETLRKYPPVPRLQRRVGVDGYKLGNVVLKKDQGVEIPAYAVHYHSEYYPNPERFDPERFMPENKHLLSPYAFLPFGAGPRNCVGMRFAYQEIKLCLTQLLRKFQFEPSSETPKKLQFSKLGLMSVKSFSLKVSRR